MIFPQVSVSTTYLCLQIHEHIIFYWFALVWYCSISFVKKHDKKSEVIVQDVFCRKCFLKHLAKSTRKHLHCSLFFNKVAGLRPAVLLKIKIRQRQVFSRVFRKILKDTFIYRTLLVTISLRYFKAGMKIYRYLCLHIKIICRRFRIISPFTFRDIRTREIWTVSFQIYGNNRIC